MKKFLFTVVFVFIVALAFAQERIAVFPFEDMDNVFTETEAVMFYRVFSNEFTNRSGGRFSVVPRQEVERLINIEAAFQLSELSAMAKTAEMQRVLNGTQILSGLIARVNNNILITISLYTYPELVQLPGGTTLPVANKDELFVKIPELVQKLVQNMQNETTPKTQTAQRPQRQPRHPKPPRPQRQPRPPVKKPEVFNDYTFFNGLTIFGYNYSFDTPIGFTLGSYGIYTSFGFSAANWGDYERVGTVNSKTGNGSPYPPNYDSSPILDQRYHFFDWVIGYNVTIIPNILYLPLGVGIETIKEWRLQNLLTGSGVISSYDPEWNPAPQGETSFLFEAGLLFRVKTPVNFAPYLSGTYRNIGIDKHSFSISVGGSFDFLANKN